MKKELVITALIGLFAFSLLLVGAKGPLQPIDVAVNMADYTIKMSPATLPALTPLRFTFTNQGVIEHQIVLEKVGTMNEPIDIGGGNAAIGILHPGERQSVLWTISQPGQYQLACHLPGHFEGGMVYTLKVAPIGDILYGQPTPLTRALGAGVLFLFLEACQLGFRRYLASIS